MRGLLDVCALNISKAHWLFYCWKIIESMSVNVNTKPVCLTGVVLI